MSLATTFGNFIGMFAPEDDTAAAPPAAANEATARARLREVHALLAPAQAKLTEATAARDRVEALVAAVGPAEAEARSATLALESATRLWAEAGARGEFDDSALAERAAEADRAAAVARARAAGAMKGLAACREAEADARRALDQARDRVRAAALHVVLAVSVEPIMQRLEHSRAEYLRAYAELEPLRVLTNPRWGAGHEFFGHSAPALTERLRAADVRTPTEREFVEAMTKRDHPAARAWAAIVTRLCEDPNVSE